MMIVIGLMFLTVYGLIVFYIGRTGWTWMKPKVSHRFKYVYILIVLFLSTSFVWAQLFEGRMILSVIGSYWLALFSLLALLLPVFHLVIWLAKLLPTAHHQVQKWTGMVLLVALLSLICYGSFNAFSTTVREYEVQIDSRDIDMDLAEEFRIVVAADMHFNYLSGKGSANRLVEEINALEPHIVLFPGDIIDDDLAFYVDQMLGDILSEIQSTHGVYASLGNHDRYHGKMHELIDTFEKSGMRVLYDEWEQVNEWLVLIGRKDYSDAKRLELGEVMEGVTAGEGNVYVMLDHQPVQYDAAAHEGIDLIVSGHTHHGQIAPGNVITRLLFENDYGYLRKGDLHTIVTSGFGFWGPPIRIGSRSEVVLIRLSIV